MSEQSGTRSLQETFKALSKDRLKISNDAASILQSYMKVAGKVCMDEYLDYVLDHSTFENRYESDANDNQLDFDLFHVILSVQVFSQSLFVPFFEVYSRKVDKGTFSLEEREHILEMGRTNINYNYSKFLSGFFKDLAGNDVPRCSFKVTVQDDNLLISNISYLPFFTKNYPWSEDDETEKRVDDDSSEAEELRKDLLTGVIIDPETKEVRVKNSFVQILSRYYADKGATELWYTFFNMDAACDSSDCLTRVMLISTRKEEAGFFMEREQHKLREIVSYIRSRYVSDLIQNNKYETIKAAIAQVMARNMSHNIGSHVFSNLIGNDVEDRFMFINDLSNYQQPLFDISSDHTPQLAFFNRYLKSRMDYLSEISFGVSDLVTTKMVYGDVMKELDCVRVLLNYIPGVANFNYGFKLYRSNPNQRDNNENALVELTEKNDIGAAFPNDVLGCQAFYNIIENIIRNTAKHHSGRDHNAPVIFSIKIREIDAKIVEIVEEAKEFYCVEIDNGLSLPEERIDKLVEQQNSLLNSPVLDEKTNNLRGYALGLLEMKASAAFLRQISQVEIDSDDFKFNENGLDYIKKKGAVMRMVILKAFKTENNALGYRFFIQKPKEFLFVGDSWGEDRPDLLGIGVHFISTNSFLNEVEKNNSFSHSYMVYDNSETKDQILASRQFKDKFEKNALLPLNILCDNDGTFADTLFQHNTDTNIANERFLTDLKRKAWNSLLNYDVCLDSGFDSSSETPYAVLLHHTENYSLHYLKENKGVLVDAFSHRTMEKLPHFNEFTINAPARLLGYVQYIDEKDRSEIAKEIYKAYNNKVIIIDERVQRFAEENKEDGFIPSWELFESTNVLIPRRPVAVDDNKDSFLPPKKINHIDIQRNPNTGEIVSKEIVYEDISLDSPDVIPLAPLSFDSMIDDIDKGQCSVKDKLLKYIDTKCSTDTDSILLIHYGILERLYADLTPNKRETKISELLKGWAVRVKRVVVTSGRGAHSLSLPDSVCFVNLSSVLYACVENRNKYLIYSTLVQSRRKRNE